MVDRVIMNDPGFDKTDRALQEFYVSVSRARCEVVVYAGREVDSEQELGLIRGWEIGGIES